MRDAILHLNCMLSRPVGRASCRALVAIKPVVTQATGLKIFIFLCLWNSEPVRLEAALGSANRDLLEVARWRVEMMAEVPRLPSVPWLHSITALGESYILLEVIAPWVQSLLLGASVPSGSI